MITKSFILAGRAVFTVQPPVGFGQASSPKCKPHYTYKVERVPASTTWPETWFVHCLTGAENDDDRNYKYLGKLDPRTGYVALTARTCFTKDSWPVRIAFRVLHRIWKGEGETVEAAGWRVEHAGKCGRCSRQLTTPASIALGLGPDCAELLGVS